MALKDLGDDDFVHFTKKVAWIGAVVSGATFLVLWTIFGSEPGIRLVITGLLAGILVQAIMIARKEVEEEAAAEEGKRGGDNR